MQNKINYVPKMSTCNAGWLCDC